MITLRLSTCRPILTWAVVLAWAGFAVHVRAEPVPAEAEQPENVPAFLTLPAAVGWALEHNPELAAVRQQHGIAAADVVIAHTYPFNPVSENRSQITSGPESARITNSIALEHLLLLEIEVHHQATYRQQGAAAALNRTDWEIAFQEQVVAVRTMRTFVGLLYRQEKLKLIDETVRLNEGLVSRARKLLDAGRLRGADLIVVQTELADARGLIGIGRTNVVRAANELAHALGVVGGSFDLLGDLDAPMHEWDAEWLTQVGLEHRPDLHARKAAIAEADARLQMEVANRHGNPVIGTAYTYDPTRISDIGVQINFPLPVFNEHKGEIQRLQEEKIRDMLELRQTEVQIQQDVQAATARLAAATASAKTYRDEVLPSLRQALDGVQRLFVQAEPGVDVLRVIDLQRKLLQARDAYLDALWEVREARADLAAAVGDPALIACPDPAPATTPAELLPPPKLVPQ